RAVKLAWLHSGPPKSDPRLWAAFILLGDGGRPVREVTSWWTAAAALVLLAAALALLLRRRTPPPHP
ncbi:MAG: hypothetical protein KGN36_09040, partial [Acidobacteriota bacterium]|nr:hypothetical protein [Acidobacteriota bacterium]